ncbi:hypothetical protein [Anaerobacillus sp. 1_MG-2023]|uniref:hypothetical protein n=1 Tax=Bacillales TaxID=1385 RepID=UPI0026E27997|nr:hypothetical protein [Anaerobacillus sp. 1_MG-2023]MDO6658457.1 hypothetical protein [Anaerobacillus sp. 1_MG-2023]
MIQVNHSIQKEIIRYQEQLRLFRITLKKLPASTPAEHATRDLCKEIAFKLASTEDLVRSIFKSRKLPYRELSKQFFYSVSILKRNSKYIIALFLLRHGNYQLLNEHLTCML